MKDLHRYKSSTLPNLAQLNKAAEIYETPIEELYTVEDDGDLSNYNLIRSSSKLSGDDGFSKRKQDLIYLDNTAKRKQKPQQQESSRTSKSRSKSSMRKRWNESLTKI